MRRHMARSKDVGESSGSTQRMTHKKEVKEAKGKSTEGEKAADIYKAEAASGNEGGIVHALLVEDIIEKIFQHIIYPTTDKISKDSAEIESSLSVAKNVQNLRLVCKQWKKTATRLYRRNRAPMMSFGKWESSRERMQNFLDVMKKSNDMIPIQRYTIEEYFFVEENEQLLKGFMHICGPGAVELRLTCACGVRNPMQFTRGLFTDLNLMGLKTLAIQYYYDGRVLHDILDLTEVFLRATGALQEFSFQFTIYHDKLGVEEELALYDRFGEFVCKRIPKTVKILRLNIPLSDLHLNILAEAELKLEELEFNCRSVRSCKVIRKFFGTQATTLKYLKMCDEQVDLRSSVPLDFPRFDELLHMELDRGIVQQFSFSDTCPKLTTLDVSGWYTESSFLELLNCTNKMVSVKELHLPCHMLQAPFVKKAAQCFPNISKLHIILSEESDSDDMSETLQEIFVYFSNVEELNLTFPFDDDGFAFNVDSMFSGVSEQDCQQIKNNRNFDNENIGDVQHLPSMLNLTKLKKFVLKDFNQVGLPGPILTDFTAHFVFLKMDSLKELETRRYWMSTKYVGLLREKLELKLLTT